jgi:hypothetical protein
MLGKQIHPKDRHGLSDCADIGRSGCKISTIFDVGANVGQSALKFQEAFPRARIHSFEPVSATYKCNI